MRVHSVLLVLVVCLGIARAEPESPWAVGVSAEEQAIALELYEKGNVEFQNARFEQALKLYESAITHWDHPAIRYNMAIAYNNLGFILEAHDNLERSLKYGEPPIGPDLYKRGLTYRENFDRRVARVRVSCQEPGTKVSLDGRTLFVAPGSVERVVLPGEHQIVAQKPGFLTQSETLDLQPGTIRMHDVRLIAMKPVLRPVRYWDAWKPRVVAGAGAGVMVLGIVAYALAESSFSKYDDGIAARCPRGCDGATLASFSDLDGHRSRGEAWRATEIALLSAGGATLAVGLALVIVNQPRMVPERLVVTPVEGGASAGARWRF